MSRAERPHRVAHIVERLVEEARQQKAAALPGRPPPLVMATQLDMLVLWTLIETVLATDDMLDEDMATVELERLAASLSDRREQPDNPPF